MDSPRARLNRVARATVTRTNWPKLIFWPTDIRSNDRFVSTTRVQFPYKACLVLVDICFLLALALAAKYSDGELVFKLVIARVIVKLLQWVCYDGGTLLLNKVISPFYTRKPTSNRDT